MCDPGPRTNSSEKMSVLNLLFLTLELPTLPLSFKFMIRADRKNVTIYHTDRATWSTKVLWDSEVHLTAFGKERMISPHSSRASLSE